MPGNTPDVAAIGDTFLVVDSHAPINPQIRFIFSRRLRGSDGVALDPSPVAIAGSFSIIPRVTVLNGRWFAVWEGHPTHDDPVANIYGAFVDTSGTPSPQLAITQDGYYVRFHNRPAVSANTTNALVLWSDPRFGNTDWAIFGRRVLPEGTVIDANGPAPSPNPPLTMPATYPGFALTTAPNNQDRPALAWNGNEYVAAWEDQRTNTFFLDQRTDIFGARAAGDSTLLDPSGFAVANAPLPETSPAVAGMNGTAMLATAIFKDSSPYTSYRIGVRTQNSQPLRAPNLQINRSGPNITLSWPADSVGFILESASSPGAPAAWNSIAQAPIINGTNFTVTLPINAAAMHFRLHRP